MEPGAGHVVIHLIGCDFGRARVPSPAQLDIINDILKVDGKADVMKGIHKGFGSRLRFARERWKLTQVQLADKAGVGVATVRRAENGYFEPRLESARRLADALHVRLEWLLTGDDPMVMLNQMTVGEQFSTHTDPGTDGLPGCVVINPGGPWFTDDDGEWQVDRAAKGNES